MAIDNFTDNLLVRLINHRVTDEHARKEDYLTECFAWILENDYDIRTWFLKKAGALFKDNKDISRAKEMGIREPNKKYDLKEIVTGDSIFCATGITSGDLVSGIKVNNNKYISETLVTHKSSNFRKVIRQENNLIL